MSELTQAWLRMTENELREILSKAGLRDQDLDKAIAEFEYYLDSKFYSIRLLSSKALKGGEGIEAVSGSLYSVLQEIKKEGVIKLEEIVRNYLRYVDHKKEIAEIYQGSKDWAETLRVVFSDVPGCSEAFVDYVEEVYQIKVRDAKHLQELTGIYHLNSYDDKGNLVEVPEGGEEAKANAVREMEEILLTAKTNKYNRALQTALSSGAKYNDLLQIKPKDYELPETWEGKLATDQYSSILWAIEEAYLIGEPNSAVKPDLRAIAQDLEAPYSVILDAHKICNRWKLQN